MAKIKVNELSKTLGIKSAELVELLQKAGSTVKSYASTLSDMHQGSPRTGAADQAG